MAVRRLGPLFFVLLALPVFSTEGEDLPLCLRAPDPAGVPTWPPSTVGPDDAARDSFFEEEVWAKVGERTCINCHSPGGDAEESKFLLRDAALDPGALQANRQAFERMASRKQDGRSRLLVKVSGGQNHGGGIALKPDSTGYRILERFVKSLESGAAPAKEQRPGPAAPSFFDGVRMASPSRLLRRLTLSLAARLPTDAEKALVAEKGEAAIDGILDAVLKEPAFYDRLKEGFNDIFLTLGYDGNADDALSYDHFEKTRHWAEKHNLDHVPEKERQKARYKLWDDYRKALKHEPLELIKYIVKNDRPFTELVTADYLLMSPYTSRGYGIFESVKGQFTNVDDPFEYVPVKLPALKGRNGKTQKTGEGVYPSAGILTMFQYLRRYPTTVTNRNRLRARMYYRHFLGIDVMALAPRVSDAAAVAKKFENPTMQAPDCVVCHKTVDPVAGLFQEYFNEEGHYGPRKEGWFTDMFGPGLEGRAMPPGDQWRSLQWLGAETAKDPRFAVAMVEHVYYLLMGRRPLLAPIDIDDPQFTPRRRAWQEQRREIHGIAAKFAKGGFNLKSVFKMLAASPFYRVDGLAAAAATPARRAELDDVGIVRLLTPEQIERKILAVFGDKWGRLESEEYRILYGGIDSKAVTERMSDPSGAMGAIQRILSNDVACRNVMRDFSRPAAERRLFPGIEPDVVPGAPEADAQIRRAMVHLHAYILGRDRAPDHPEIERTWELFTGILEDAHARKGIGKEESYFCGARQDRNSDKGQVRHDPTYAVRAWRAVVTYLLRQDDFLYE